jgi:hypothetical protein
MKFLLLATFVFITSTAFSQNTTQEEYNFMSKGFKTMIDEGLDMKKGYFLKDTMSFSTSAGKYQTTFINMMRHKDKTYAGTISVVKSNSWSRIYYLAIPAADTDGQIDLAETLMTTITNYAWDSAIKTAYLQALAEYMSMNFTKLYSKKAK